MLSSSRETTTTPGLYFLSPAPGFTDSTTSSTRKRTAPSGPRGFAITPLASNSSVARREQEGLGVRGPATVHPSRLALLAHQLGAGPFAQALSEESICGHLAVPGPVVEEEHEEAKVSREAWASGGGRG